MLAGLQENKRGDRERGLLPGVSLHRETPLLNRKAEFYAAGLCTVQSPGILRGRRQNRGDCRAWARLALFLRPRRGLRRERGWPLLVSYNHARPLIGFWKAFPFTPPPFLLSQIRLRWWLLWTFLYWEAATALVCGRCWASLLRWFRFHPIRCGCCPVLGP